jgi:hypothetical protein
LFSPPENKKPRLFGEKKSRRLCVQSPEDKRTNTITDEMFVKWEMAEDETMIWCLPNTIAELFAPHEIQVVMTNTVIDQTMWSPEKSSGESGAIPALIIGDI